MSNSFDPDQARSTYRSVGPDLGPNCLQKLLADDIRSYRVSDHLYLFSQGILIINYAIFFHFCPISIKFIWRVEVNLQT